MTGPEQVTARCPDCDGETFVTVDTEVRRSRTELCFYRNADGSVSEVDRGEFDSEIVDTERGEAITCTDCGAEVFDADDLSYDDGEGDA